MEYEDIFFDEDDQNIFLVDDVQLKADALRHSVLPKIQAACHYLVELIRDTYGTEILDDSSFTLSPHFRTHNRVVEMKKNYSEAALEIAGKRQEGYWPGLQKPDGTPVTIVPFGMSLVLDQFGMSTSIYLARPTYTKQTFKKFFDFLLQYEKEIAALLHRAEYSYWNHLVMKEFPPISPLSSILKWCYDSGSHQVLFEGKAFGFPLENSRVIRKLYDLVFVFPIYDSFVRISKNEPERFAALLDKMNKTIWEMEIDELAGKYEEKIRSRENDRELLEKAKESADKRISVMPSIRWQVLQRDNWKCVSCGKSADDNIWLEVDHIIPRSKGGKNEISNYQTLCNVCNIGKSNKDDTDIRQQRKRAS